MKGQKINSIPRLILFLGSVLATSFSIAHEQKTAVTDIFYNERTGNLEIAHRFSLHDAEHTLYKATKSNADLTRSSRARAAFAKYIADRFKLTFTDNTTLRLSLVGQELERGYLWVYQESKIPKPVDTPFFIENRMLFDVVKGQVNTVNVRYRSQVSTFVFETNTGKKLYGGPSETRRKSSDAGKR